MASFSVPRSVAPNDLTTHARSHPISAALLLFVVLIALRVIRQGRTPTSAETGGLVILAVGVVLSAMLMPSVVVAFLGALALVMAANLSTQLSAQFDKLTALVGGLSAKAGG
jgi:flagellar biosynthesis protein FlhB